MSLSSRLLNLLWRLIALTLIRITALLFGCRNTAKECRGSLGFLLLCLRWLGRRLWLTGFHRLCRLIGIQVVLASIMLVDVCTSGASLRHLWLLDIFL